MMCDRMPNFEDIREHKPAAFALVDWCRMFLGGAHCEPRRWFPQRWVSCPAPRKGFLERCWVNFYNSCAIVHQPFPDSFWLSFLQSPTDWHPVTHNDGVCAPGVGPVCEVGP